MIELKTDCTLLARLYIACQTRGGDLDEFFSHENQSHPPSLSRLGNLRMGTKSDLVTCLSECHTSYDALPKIDALVLDGPAVVQMLKPGHVKKFSDYAQQVFFAYITSNLRNVTRLDVVFDVYRPDSLKLMTREKRGKGVRRHVSGSSNIPNNWHDFLRVDDNKTELFKYLAESMTGTEIQGKQLIATICESVTSMPHRESVILSPCTHEEADTRMLLHCLDAAQQGHQRIAIRTVDTDVVVLAVSFFSFTSM